MLKTDGIDENQIDFLKSVYCLHFLDQFQKTLAYDIF